MGDKASASSSAAQQLPATARGRGDWSKTKEQPKRGKSKPLEEEEEEEEEEEGEADEEDEEEEEEEEEADEEDDGDETGSDTDREQRKKGSRKPGKKVKEEDKRRKPAKKTPPSAGRRKAAKEANYDSDGSETSSQGATDDEMDGRRAQPLNATRSSGDANEGGNASPEAPRERNSSMTLPSLSRAAMMHMNRGRDGSEGESGSNNGGSRPDKRSEDSPANGYNSANAESNNRGPSGSAGWRRERSRSCSRERQDPREGGGRWSESNQTKDNGRGGAEESGSGYSGEGSRGGGSGGGGGGQREQAPPSPGPDSQDVRIMFHGREIYADDLIGLRVAKTFVGHGRFLGQVVKFDEPTSLYTIVYADGDAEELSIENTIQILIQDEIERADPSVPPVPSAYRNDRIPDSPEGGSVTPASSTATVSVPVAPLSTSGVPPPQSQHQQPVYQSRRLAMAFTEREAQFVIGVFENNALPVLLRQGWRVQSNASGTEQRFYAPPGNFRGAGHVFTSAIDVVELIVFDNELLSACFPQNMHSVILSLFQDSAGSAAASRKRGSPAVPSDAADAYDSKRVRGGREGYPSGGAAPMLRAGGPGVGGSIGLPPTRGDDRLVPPVSYRGDDRERGERDGYAAQRIAPLASGERFPGPASGRGDPSDCYRRPTSGASAADYRSLPQRPLSSEGGAPSSRWAGAPPTGGAQDSSDYHHRRGYGDAPEWHDRDPMGGRGGPAPGASYMGGRPSAGAVHRGDEPNRGGGVYYGGDRGLPRAAGGPGLRPGGSSIGAPGAGGDEPPSSYGRYRDARGPAPPGGQYSPGPDSFPNRYPPSRGEPSADYRGGPGGGPPPQGFARPLSRGGSAGPPTGPGASGSRGFSMMDVDRNASGGSSSGGYDHHRMDRGRSPHLGEGGAPPGSASSYGGPSHLQQHYGHHQRSGSNGSLPNPADDSRTM